MENQEMQSPQMSMGMPVPGKRKGCCKGLKILAIVLGILVLGLACLSAMLLMKKDGERASDRGNVGESLEVEGELEDEVAKNEVILPSLSVSNDGAPRVEVLYVIDDTYSVSFSSHAVDGAGNGCGYDGDSRVPIRSYGKNSSGLSIVGGPSSSDYGSTYQLLLVADDFEFDSNGNTTIHPCTFSLMGVFYDFGRVNGIIAVSSFMLIRNDGEAMTEEPNSDVVDRAVDILKNTELKLSLKDD